MKSVLRLTRRQVHRARNILPHWQIAIRKPATLAYIVITAYRAHITLVILLVFMVFLAPTIIDFVTCLVFPPETSKKIFGLIKTQQASPLQGMSFLAIMTILWLGSIVSALLLFWFHIPRGLVLANARAKTLVAAGDSNSDSIKSRALYSRALAIATDPDLESELRTRLAEEISPSATATPTRATEISERVCDKGTIINTSESAHTVKKSPSPTGLAERYELGEQIGSGAMGVVYGAWDKVLDRKVAIKQLSMILSGDDEYVLRFRREAQALARLNHPNVVQVHDLLEAGNRLWMVVEYVDGGNLTSYLNDNGPLPICQAVNMIIPIAEGLALAHSQGIIHRDLKPANILLTSARTPKITDFGIAKLSRSGELTQAGSVLGSPPYMSPEQCSGGSVDSRTDIYALGITLYELLTGKKPFDGDTSSVLARHIVEQPAPLSEHLEEISPELEELVLQMLAKSPDERPSGMTKVADLLSDFRSGTLSLERSQSGHYTV